MQTMGKRSAESKLKVKRNTEIKLKKQEKITKLYAKGLAQFIGNKIYKKCKKCRFVICRCFQNVLHR
jgi:hypothetical protein